MINFSSLNLFSADSGSGATQQSNIWTTVITFGLLIAVVVVFYFVILRPQKKQQKQEEQMRQGLKCGDQITTIGGIKGIVVSIKGDNFTIVTSRERTRITFSRSALRTIDVPAPTKETEESSSEQTQEQNQAPVETTEEKKN